MPYTNKNIGLFFLLLSFSTILLLNDQLLKNHFPRSILELPVIPIKEFTLRQRRAIDQRFAYISECHQCRDQLSHLQDQQFQTATLISQLGQLKEENAALRKLLGAPLPGDWQFLPARVIGKGDDFVYINQGSNTGVRAEMTVIAQGVLVGQIVDSSPHQSQVRLLRGQLKIPALVRTPETQQQVAQGVVEYQDSRLLLTKVLPSEKLISDDLVITSGQGGFLPDIPIGQVSKVFMAQSTDTFQQAEIRPLADFDHLSQVEVVINW